MNAMLCGMAQDPELDIASHEGNSRSRCFECGYLSGMLDSTHSRVVLHMHSPSIAEIFWSPQHTIFQ